MRLREAALVVLVIVSGIPEVEAVGNLPGDTIAIVTSATGEIEMRIGGKGDWRKIEKGQRVRVQDELRTGISARARLEFADRDDDADTGPTILNMGANTHIVAESFVMAVDKIRGTGLVELLGGAIRSFTQFFADETGHMSVRTGTTLCGIRGTDYIAEYDPITRRVVYMVDHGLVVCENPRTWLEGGEAVTIVDGQAGPVRPLTPAEFAEELTKSLEGHGIVEEELGQAGPNQWQGDWTTDQFGTMRFNGSPQGNVGDYSIPRQSPLYGTTGGSRFTGTWVQTTARRKCDTMKHDSFYWGDIVLTMDAAGQTFMGTYNYCGGATPEGAMQVSGRRK